MEMNLPVGATRILDTLERAGFPGYVVGGCVRDALLSIEPKDYDICTPARPDEMVEIFKDFRQIDTGLKHGTLGILTDGELYEVTTFRTDGSYSDNRHPDSVRFVDDLVEDLARRDFTVNAMAYHPKTGLCDPFGGAADLRAGLIRAVGEPTLRFHEDALRILRGLRFASVYDFAIEEQTAKAIHECAPLLKNVAAERIRVECDKLLCGSGVGRILLEYPDVIGVFIPEILPTIGYDQNNHFHPYTLWEHIVRTVEAIDPTPLLRWTMLLHDLGKPEVRTTDEFGESHFSGHPETGARIADGVFSRLKFDRATWTAACELIATHRDRLPDTRVAMRHLIAAAGIEGARNRLAVRYADDMGKSEAVRAASGESYHARIALWEDVSRNEHCFAVKDLPINGNDLVSIGVPKGPGIGKILSMLLEKVLDGELPCERAALLDFAAKNWDNFSENS